MEIMKLLNALPGAVSQGVIWGIMAIGVYITYRILDVADLTVDGSIATGGAVAAVLIISGCNAWVALVAAFVVGMLTGLVTGVFHTWMGDSCHPIGHSDAACALFHQPWHHEQQGEHGGECE